MTPDDRVSETGVHHVGWPGVQPTPGVERVGAEDTPSVCEEADRLVSEERDAKYGHPAANLGRAAVIWAAILGQPVTAEQVALCMAGLKLAREVGGHDRDNLIDLAGYAQLVELIREERGAW